MFKRDPLRPDEVAFYSNVLYSTGQQVQFNNLTGFILPKLDQNRPEVCCAIANQLSLRHEHEKAVKYLKKATELDRTYYQAWTLMGHEYLELNNNTHAAIECYRRAVGGCMGSFFVFEVVNLAVDVNPKDFRAWFGLGQTYIMLSLHTYAVHYFQKALVIRSVLTSD